MSSIVYYFFCEVFVNGSFIMEYMMNIDMLWKELGFIFG